MTHRAGRLDARRPLVWLPALACCATFVATPARGLEVTVSQNTKRLMPYQVFELTFQHSGEYRDPTWDVSIDVVFTARSGKRYTVGGFFYGSSKPQHPTTREWTDGQGRKRQSAVWPCEPADLWRARYAPNELGSWRYEYVFRNPSGESAKGKGAFEVVKGRVHQKGWVRQHPRNPHRWVFEDGSAYFPIGFQDCIGDGNHNGSVMDSSAMEGPYRLDPEGKRPKLPPGAMFVRGPSMNPQNFDVHYGRHSRAGINLYRFSPNNCSLHLFTEAADSSQRGLNHIRWEEARMIDEMFEMVRKYDMRIFYGIFGFAKACNEEPDNAECMAKAKRIIKYSVDRWGAYVDLWQLLNEQKASDAWYRIMIDYLKSIDPYGKPLSTSWERPEIDGIDITAPHWYDSEDERQSDVAVLRKIAPFKKKYGKPIIFGEQGNDRDDYSEPVGEGVGGVWDPGSARRMRVRNWTGLFNEVAFVFWETSYAKDGHSINLWMGPQERQYLRAMQSFAACLDKDVRMTEVPKTGKHAAEVHAYGLRSDTVAAIYLHHHRCRQCAGAGEGGRKTAHRWDHDRGQVEDLKVTVDVPKASEGYWYDPRDASIVGQFEAKPGPMTVGVPPFAIDMALLITPRGEPDVDGDGKPNRLDPDDDNDGVPDVGDAWPLEREEWEDVDGDRIGDNLDADVDADGKGDDLNGNGQPDHEETDIDGDGVPTADTIPWDAFPRDPKEWRDTDGDGVGDNADPDDDGDGFTDEQERIAGTDPLDPVSFPER
ncbi:MAG TPA: DUF5060 domain-containing protein [Phycisphaerae bacterium]|nr:DUF5060 domain-containing protein [Phycisphaerae bacterium]